MQYIDGTNYSTYSTFTQSNDLTPDQMIMFQDVSVTEMTNMERLQALQKKSYLTDAERIEMTELLTSLREYMPTSEDWNKLCAGLYSVEVFMRDGIVMFVKQKQDEFQAMLDNYTYIGEYNSATQYKKGNMVTFGGYGFTCRKDCKGVSPSINGTTEYWTLYTIKGDKGEPSLNIYYKGEYDATKTYNLSTGDAVSVDGTLYYAKLNGVIGKYPPYYSDSWASLSNDSIYISTVLPTIGNRRKDTMYFLQTDTDNLKIGTLQDYLGNEIHPKTDSSNVIHNGVTVESALDDLNKVYTTTNNGNNYSVAIPNLTTLTDGYPISIKFNVASTGVITVNPNGLGAKNVVDYFGNQVKNVRANLIVNLRYEATSGNFQLQGKGGDGTAIASQLIKGATATTKDGEIVGTLDLSNLVSNNIKKNIVINGITGDSNVVDTSDATVVASKMLSGESAYGKGNKIIGNIPSKSAQTFIPTTYNQTVNSGQYLNGVQTILGDPNLVASNIVSGKSIFGIFGDTANKTIKYQSGVINNGYDYTAKTTVTFPFTVIAVIFAGSYQWVSDGNYPNNYTTKSYSGSWIWYEPSNITYGTMITSNSFTISNAQYYYYTNVLYYAIGY